MAVLKKLMLIANPVSGKKAVGNSLGDVCRIFLENGWATSVFITGQRGDATQFVKEYGAGFDRIVSMGGDGTMNEVVTGMLSEGLSVPFAFIPSGTTNDFASTHHIPSDILEAAKLAATGKVRYLDACRFNDRYFMFHCACGFFANVVNSTYQELKNSLGYFAYILDGIVNALSIAPRHLKLIIDGKDLEGDYIYVGFLSTLSLGGNISSLPVDMVRADDGEFEVMLAKAPKDIIDLGQELLEFTDGKTDGDFISLFKMKKCVIDSDEDLSWSLDGEPYTGSTHIEMEVLDRKLLFVSSDDDTTIQSS